MRHSAWSRPLLLVLACAVVGCQTASPIGGNTVPASATSRLAAGMGMIRGTVKVDTGQLISAGGQNYRLSQASAAGGRVTARSSGSTVEGPVGPDGSYSLEVPGGYDYTLEATVPDGRGGVTRVVSPTPVSVPLAQEPPIVDAASLVTRRTGSIQGLVELKDAKAGDTPEGVDVFLSGGTSVVGKAGESGRFALTNVAEGTWNVVFSKPGYKRQVVKGVAVRSGRPAMLEASVVLERETAAASGVRGSVQSSTGQAIIGATVSLYPKDRAALGASDAGLDNFTAITDDQGRYEILNLPAGEYSVQVYRPFYQLVPRRVVTVAPGASQDLGVTKLVSNVTYFGRVSGEVVDEAGKPIEGAVAQLDPPVTESQFADATGKFTLDRILPGEYNMTVAAGGYQPVIIPVMVDNSPGFELETGTTSSYQLQQGSRQFVVRVGRVSLAKATGVNGFPAIRPLAPVALGDEDYVPVRVEPGAATPVSADGLIRTAAPRFAPKPAPVERGQALPSVVGHPDFRSFKPNPEGSRLGDKDARLIAQRYFERTRAEEGAETAWSGAARLSPQAPLALQDGLAKGPGAFEFQVESAAGEPLGHIVVNTSREMLPVPESADEGRGCREGLLAAYREKFKREPKTPIFYRFSSFSYGIEDAEDGTWATQSVGPIDFEKLRAGKRELLELNGQNRFIADRWRELETPTPAAASSDAKGYRLMGTLEGFGREVPRYWQHRYNGCVVGCVPVAWGMVYGYWEQKGRNTIAGAASTNFTQNANVQSMTEAVNRYCQTACVSGEGATIWYDSPDGAKWGRDDRNKTVDINQDYFWTDFNMFKTARDAIKVKRPPILAFDDEPNTNGGGHAVVVTGYYQHDDWGWWDDVERLYVNTGWQEKPRLRLTLGSNCLNLRWVMTVNVKD